MAGSLMFDSSETRMIESLKYEHRSRTAENWKAFINAMVEDYSPTQLFTSPSSYLNGVSPLFIASLQKNSMVVRYLIENEADVSARISNDSSNDWNAGLTPLHGAFFSEDRHDSTSSKQLDIIRCLVEAGADPSALSSKGVPIWMMGWIQFYPTESYYSSILRSQAWCNPRAVTLLVELGMSVTQCCPVGRTLFHHLAGIALVDDPEVFNLLLEKGADVNARDNEGITPIMAAAIGNNHLPNIPILKFLLERKEIPNIDKIIALEVASAVLLIYESRLSPVTSDSLYKEGKYEDHHEDIFNFLLQAKILRQEIHSVTHEFSINGQVVESFTSLENFSHIRLRPMEYLNQAMLILLRNLSSVSWGAIYRYLWPFINDRYYRKIKYERDFDKILDISFAVLETMSRFDVQEKGIYITTLGVVEFIYDALYQFEYELRRSNDRPLFNIESVMKSLDLLKPVYQAVPPEDELALISRYRLTDFYYLVLILNDLPVLMGMQQVAEFVRFIVSQNGHDADGRTFLHKAVREAEEKVLETVGFLLRNGADARAVDRAGNGVFHYLAKKRGNEQREAVARLLLDNGADLNLTNSEGKTAADVWREKTEQRTEKEIFWEEYRDASYEPDTDDDLDERYADFNADPPEWVKAATSQTSND